jgi:dihydroorotate dehydrogenase electron transfer subunit
MGRVSEIRLGSGRNVETCIVCPESVIPAAGQYLLAFDQDDPDVVLSTPLFAIEKSNQGFWAAPQFPINWPPGTILNLIGPLGHGFDLPRNIQRLGLVALGETVSRLIPLVRLTTQSHASMTLFTDLSLPRLPAALEVSPLASLKDSLDWSDFLALDVPLVRLPEIRAILGLSDREILPCPAQVLVTTPIPCAGMAQCGACAVPAWRGWKLACEDGPVFDLRFIRW